MFTGARTKYTRPHLESTPTPRTHSHTSKTLCTWADGFLYAGSKKNALKMLKPIQGRHFWQAAQEYLISHQKIMNVTQARNVRP